MATVCTIANLDSTETAKFSNLRPHKRRAVMVYMLMKGVAAAGGTDYTTDFAQLLEDVAPFRALRQDQREGALIEIFKEQAESLGATISDDINDIMEAIACIECERDLDVILGFLTCAISS